MTSTSIPPPVSVGVRRILLALGTLAGLVALAVAAAGHIGPLPL